jgi:protein O-mannosyl-transferase
LPVGKAVMADRYVYLASIGLCFNLSFVYESFFSRYSGLRWLVLLHLLLLTALTFNQSRVWKDSLSLWTKVIKHEPTLAIAYHNRAEAYAGIGQIQAAENDWNQTLLLDPNYAPAYRNRAKLKLMAKEWPAALADLNKAIELDSNTVESYKNRAFAKMQIGQNQESIEDWNRVIVLQPTDREARHNRGLACFRLNRREQACMDWTEAFRLGNAASKPLLDKYCPSN